MEAELSELLGHASVTTAGMNTKIADKIAENPAPHLDEVMGHS
jgi:hypothetical protein